MVFTGKLSQYMTPRFIIIGVLGWVTFWSTPSLAEEGVKLSIDLQPFRAMVQEDLCADLRSRLFLIDETYVLWDQASTHCPDHSYSVTLFWKNPDLIMCLFSDSIVGPRESCEDDQLQGMFHRILQHLQDPTLGVGEYHSVEAVSLKKGP